MRIAILRLATFSGVLTWYTARLILWLAFPVGMFIAGAQFQRELTDAEYAEDLLYGTIETHTFTFPGENHEPKTHDP